MTTNGLGWLPTSDSGSGKVDPILSSGRLIGARQDIADKLPWPRRAMSLGSTSMRLFHFSETLGLSKFIPRPVETPVARPVGYEWLNGPLVWAINEAHSFLYLFPRNCPRILLWETARTTDDDRLRWMGETDAWVVAYIEAHWEERLERSTVFRYELPPISFEDVGEIGMWISRSEVNTLEVVCLADLRGALKSASVELRIMESLTWLRPAWESTIHASGIRLRNAIGWGEPGWPHSQS